MSSRLTKNESGRDGRGDEPVVAASRDPERHRDVACQLVIPFEKADVEDLRVRRSPRTFDV
jgi:hypothetical protein